ncbi:MAG TPA: antibiotic biosynthesis monooxygenase [Terriglobales bacterium]|nr:antibiotic biosynthesis monooxygenase [Terriglobales bacterium]
MFARVLNFEIKPEKKEDFVKLMKDEILPILRKQPGFLEVLPFFPEKLRDEKVLHVSLWMDKADAERYEREQFPKIHEMLKPHLATAINVRPYHLETKLCEHFVETIAA